MRITLRLVAPMLAAAGAAAAIAAAPMAAASDNHLACTSTSQGNSQCETPGNVQLSATPPVVSYPQQYPYFYGGFGGPIIVNHGGGGHR
jgi:uncharacterized membrane protein